MAVKRQPAKPPGRQVVRKRQLPGGVRRTLHITLPLAVARRLDRIVLERDAANASVVLCDLIERCPIRSFDVVVEPAEGGDRPAGEGRG
jgi:hypothetical protein